MATLANVLAAVRGRESVGVANRLGVSPYSLTPQQNYDYPRSHASGAYQVQPGTWRAWTVGSGIGTQYAEAYQAPPGVQDQVAGWAASHYNPNSSYLWGASAPSGGYPSVDPGSTLADSGGIGDTGGGITAGGGIGTSGLTINPDLNPGLGSDPGTLSDPGTGGPATATGTPVGTPDTTLDPSVFDPFAESPGFGMPGAAAQTATDAAKAASDAAKAAAGGIGGSLGTLINLPGAIAGGISSLIGAAESWISTGLIGLLAIVLVLIGLFWLIVGSPAKVAKEYATKAAFA